MKGAANVQNNIFFVFFRTAFRSSERRQYSVPLLRDLRVASLIIIGRLRLLSLGEDLRLVVCALVAQIS